MKWNEIILFQASFVDIVWVNGNPFGSGSRIWKSPHAWVVPLVGGTQDPYDIIRLVTGWYSGLTVLCSWCWPCSRGNIAMNVTISSRQWWWLVTPASTNWLVSALTAWCSVRNATYPWTRDCLARWRNGVDSSHSESYAIWLRDALELTYDQVHSNAGQAVRRQKRLYDQRAVKRIFTVSDWTMRYYPPAKKCTLVRPLPGCVPVAGLPVLPPLPPPPLRIGPGHLLHPFSVNGFDAGPVRLASIAHAFNYRVTVLLRTEHYTS